MGIKLNRQKKRNLLLTIIYRINKLIPISANKKLQLYLDLEWIFDRLSHETSFAYFDEEKHPVRIYSKEFILNHITPDHVVLDLGCKYGNMSNYIAKKAKKVIGIDFDEKAIEIAKNSYAADIRGS
jgi:2-polyprenyl-3-methyl-5-hydroxy-6-metoxy-1,4-benzoquinol methylase